MCLDVHSELAKYRSLSEEEKKKMRRVGVMNDVYKSVSDYHTLNDVFHLSLSSDLLSHFNRAVC